jgi:glycosyltransferase involved in cell wall biosynthesis
MKGIYIMDVPSRVSINVSVYNAEKYIGECVDSIVD